MGKSIPRTSSKRVLIIGCGFAGIKLARKLSPLDMQVVLIDKLNYHQFQPLFYQVATSGIEPSAISFPIRKIFQAQQNLVFRVGEVKNIHPINKTVDTTIGEISYDYLVIATGAKTSFFGMSNLEKYTYPMKTTADSIILRNRLLQNIEDAVGNIDDAERKALLNVVVIGGGPTGVEISGALGEMKNFIIPKDYKEIDIKEVKVTLIESGTRILPYMSHKASNRAEAYLSELGVTIEKNVRVVDYDGETLTLANGVKIASKTVVWAAGIAGSSIPGLPDSVIGRANRIKVNAYNQVEGFFDIFAIGDIALMAGDANYPNGHPQVAPVAMQQALNLSKNFRSILEGTGMASFVYSNQGTMATIGRNRAVVDFKFIEYYGFLAWATWLFVHLMSIVGIKNRLIIFINWMWSYFTYDQSLRLIIRTCNCKPDDKTGKEDVK